MKAQGQSSLHNTPSKPAARSRLIIGDFGPSDSALAASSGWRLRRPAADRHAARCASRDLCSGGAPRRYPPSVENEDGQVAYHPELPVPIGFSSRELIVKANKKWSGRTNRAVREWIERLNSTAIHGAMFSAKERKYDVRIGLEPLFRQYVHVGHVMSDGQLAPQNYVWPAQWFLDNYYYLYTRPIDLKSPDANGFRGHSLKPPIEEAIKKFCNQVG